MQIAQKTRDKKQILFCQPLTNVLPITCKFIVCRQQFFMMREVHAIFANIDIADGSDMETAASITSPPPPQM